MDWDEISREDTSVIMNVYRGEIQRINTWRTRMDRTTNWAIVMTVGVLTFALGTKAAPHWTMLPGLFLTYVLLFAEARRYRYYDAWRGRVRALEEMFLSRFFDSDVEVDTGWQDLISRDFREPEFKVTWSEAVKRRLKRMYIWIIFIFTLSWVGKVLIHPNRATTVKGFFTNVGGGLGIWGGAAVFTLIMGLILGSTVYFFVKAPKREAKGRMREKKDVEFELDGYIEDEKCEE